MLEYRYTLNICMRITADHSPGMLTGRLSGDVGGQRTLRPYWRNYFEQTDALVWVVDSGDRMRMQDCKEEIHSLLQEDVCHTLSSDHTRRISSCPITSG